jgi:hypothetical protein
MILPSETGLAASAGRALFQMGRLFITPAAMEAVAEYEIIAALRRHLRGDWGNVCPEDREENDRSLRKGFRLLSVYQTAKGTTFWIITEADRSATTVLLPSDY